MRNSLIVLLTALVIAGAFAPAVAGGAAGATTQADATCEYPETLTDATGEEITIEESPDRIVALQPSDAQTVFEIGAEENLVGMPVKYTDHDAGDRTDVHGEENIDVETVIDLEPDIVLAANVTLADDVEQLRQAGLTVYHFETASSIDDIRENVRLTGQLTGACEGAEERIDWMDDRLEAIETALEDEERPLAFWALGSGYTAGEGTFQHEILTTAGVTNLAAEEGLEGWPEISQEIVVDADPEWIIYGVDDTSDPDDPDLREQVMETTAYEEDNLVAVDSNAVNQPAPHVVYAIETIVEAIHPEAYEEAQAILEEDDGDDGDGEDENGGEAGDADDATDADGTETEDENSTETDDGDGDDSVPGFGVPIAVAALLAVIGLESRRR